MTQLHRALSHGHKHNPSRPWTLWECKHQVVTGQWGGSSLQPSVRPCVLWAKTTGVYDPAALDKHLWTVIAMCVCVCFLWLGCAGVLCVISGVLNDLCSMCNWVALPEISMGLTLKLSFILGRLQWAGRPSPDRDLTGVKESKAALSALFKCQADVKHSWPVSMKSHRQFYPGVACMN